MCKRIALKLPGPFLPFISIGTPFVVNYSVGTWNQLSLVTRKPVFGVCDQVKHKPACAAAEASYSLEISDIETILSRQRTIKALIRFCTDAQADLRLCCLHMAKTCFLMRWLNCFLLMMFVLTSGVLVKHACILKGICILLSLDICVCLHPTHL